MLIPFITGAWSNNLTRRKGGGGHGGGGGRGGKSNGGGKSPGSGKGSSNSISNPGINVAGTSKMSSTHGFGGGPVFIIPPNNHFSGRRAGGGNRSTIYGSREYGSGYPGISGRGVGGRGFPYWFWPIVWVSAVALIAPAAYLYAAVEYGLPGNLDRPGGPMINAAFMSSSTGAMYRVLSDNSTVVTLSAAIKTNCSSSIGDSSSLPVGNSSDSSQAQAEQAIQYYRASSVVLTMDGYNNSAIFGPEGTLDSALPTNVDTTLLNCINNTIGASVPLVDAAWLPLPEYTIVSFFLLHIVYFLFDAFM